MSQEKLCEIDDQITELRLIDPNAFTARIDELWKERSNVVNEMKKNGTWERCLNN